MDPISYGVAAKQKQRIEKVIAEPDSVAGLVSVPNLVPTGETITIPAGRTVVHPNLKVDGTLDVQGTLFVPAGGSVTQSLVDATVVKQNGSVVANDSTVVHKTGDETVAGVKTFSSSPVVPNLPLTSNDLNGTNSAFVWAHKGGLAKQQSAAINIDFTLTQSYANKLLPIDAGCNTITLPAINTILSGSLFIISVGKGRLPVSIALNSNAIETESLKIAAGETLVIQSDGGSYYRVISRTSKLPDYASGILLSYNTTYLAYSDLTLIVLLTGYYMNGAQIVVGETSAPSAVIARVGDDISANTKEAYMSAQITGGTYFKVEAYGGREFEGIAVCEYRHK